MYNGLKCIEYNMSNRSLLSLNLPDVTMIVPKLLDNNIFKKDEVEVTAALEEVKAKDIVTIDVRGKTSITDFMIIASGGSARQVKALAENVIDKAKENGVRPVGSEGLDGGEWALIDLNDVVVHVMQVETREHYDLERLWQGAEQSRAQHNEQGAE